LCIYHPSDQSQVLYDEEKFRSDLYQRVYHFLKMDARGLNMEKISFAGTPKAFKSTAAHECLQQII